MGAMKFQLASVQHWISTECLEDLWQHGSFHLRPYANWSLLQINMPKSWN